MHGAPIQCTRGKCSKAFHISCAREGTELGIVYKELAEVEKDVVFVDVATVPSLPTPMDIDGGIPLSPSQNAPSDSVDAKTPNKDAVKVVKKMEFQLLCAQHNPVSATRPFPRISSFIMYYLRSSYLKPKRLASRTRSGRICSPLRRCQESRFALVLAYLKFRLSR
jgi:hypothetical protein